MKKRALSFNLYYILLFSAILYTAASFFFLPEQTQYYDIGAEMREVEPVSVVQTDDITRVYTLHIDTPSDTSRSLYLSSAYEDVEIYCDGKLAYERTATPSIFGKSPGCGINLLTLPGNVYEIQVKLQVAYPFMLKSSHVFYYGNGPLMMHQLIKESIIQLASGWMILVVGLFMYGFWLLTHKKFMINKSVCYFSKFALILGLWESISTHIAVILIPNRVFSSILGYLLIGFLVYPFIQFNRNYLGLKKNLLFYIIAYGSLINIVICCTLQIVFHIDFRETAFMFHAFLWLSLLYVFWGTWYCFKNRMQMKKVITNFVCFFCLSLSSVFDLISFFNNKSQSSMWGKVGFFIFILSLAIQLISESYVQINEGKKAVYYKDLAYTDIMTGLHNRGAFEKWELDTDNYTGYTIITFDLNNLKSCNDNLGHAKGDTYITTCASLIKEHFEPLGTCYRIGGDEFCVVTKYKSMNAIRASLKSLYWSVNQYNQKSNDIQLGIAYGIAEFCKNDQDFEATRSRADKSMYENKKLQKRIS